MRLTLLTILVALTGATSWSPAQERGATDTGRPRHLLFGDELVPPPAADSVDVRAHAGMPWSGLPDALPKQVHDLKRQLEFAAELLQALGEDLNRKQDVAAEEFDNNLRTRRRRIVADLPGRAVQGEVTFLEAIELKAEKDQPELARLGELVAVMSLRQPRRPDGADRAILSQAEAAPPARREEAIRAAKARIERRQPRHLIYCVGDDRRWRSLKPGSTVRIIGVVQSILVVPGFELPDVGDGPELVEHPVADVVLRVYPDVDNGGRQ